MMELTDAEQEELTRDVQETRERMSDPAWPFERRKKIHDKWIVSGKITADEWLRLVQENGG